MQSTLVLITLFTRKVQVISFVKVSDSIKYVKRIERGMFFPFIIIATEHLASQKCFSWYWREACTYFLKVWLEDTLIKFCRFFCCCLYAFVGVFFPSRSLCFPWKVEKWPHKKSKRDITPQLRNVRNHFLVSCCWTKWENIITALKSSFWYNF